MNFSRIAVLGPGLLGGSLALELAARRHVDLRLWARRAEPLDQARGMGVEGVLTTDLGEALRGADLAVLCTPVGVMPALAQRLVTIPDGPRTITDVGSVKEPLERSVGEVLVAAGRVFVGSHPMCGSELKGMEAARTGLYEGAVCVVTHPADGEQETGNEMDAVCRFWEEMGMRVIRMGAAEHDSFVARVSHLPHAVAAVLARVALETCPDAADLAAGGFRDTTRIAGGSPEMWREILVENSHRVAPLLRECASSLEEMASALERGDETSVLDALEAGKASRNCFDDSVARRSGSPPDSLQTEL